jgi:hypothetical protein
MKTGDIVLTTRLYECFCAIARDPRGGGSGLKYQLDRDPLTQVHSVDGCCHVPVLPCYAPKPYHQGAIITRRQHNSTSLSPLIS